MATKPRKTKSVKEPSYKINTGEGDGFTAVISGLENIGSIADTTGLSKGLSNFIDKANADLRQQKYAEWANNKIASKAASAKAKIDMANARANHNRSGGTAELLAGTGIFTHPHSVGQPVRQHSSVNEYLGKTVSKRHAEALAAKNAPYTPIDLGRWEGQSRRGRRDYSIGGATTVGMYADRYGSGGYHLNSTVSGMLEGSQHTSLKYSNALNERRSIRYEGPQHWIGQTGASLVELDDTRLGKIQGGSLRSNSYFTKTYKHALVGEFAKNRPMGDTFGGPGTTVASTGFTYKEKKQYGMLEGEVWGQKTFDRASGGSWKDTPLTPIMQQLKSGMKEFTTSFTKVSKLWSSPPPPGSFGDGLVKATKGGGGIGVGHGGGSGDGGGGGGGFFGQMGQQFRHAAIWQGYTPILAGASAVIGGYFGATDYSDSAAQDLMGVNYNRGQRLDMKQRAMHAEAITPHVKAQDRLKVIKATISSNPYGTSAQDFADIAYKAEEIEMFASQGDMDPVRAARFSSRLANMVMTKSKHVRGMNFDDIHSSVMGSMGRTQASSVLTGPEGQQYMEQAGAVMLNAGWKYQDIIARVATGHGAGVPAAKLGIFDRNVLGGQENVHMANAHMMYDRVKESVAASGGNLVASSLPDPKKLYKYLSSPEGKRENLVRAVQAQNILQSGDPVAINEYLMKTAKRIDYLSKHGFEAQKYTGKGMLPVWQEYANYSESMKEKLAENTKAAWEGSRDTGYHEKILDRDKALTPGGKLSTLWGSVVNFSVNAGQRGITDADAAGRNTTTSWLTKGVNSFDYFGRIGAAYRLKDAKQQAMAIAGIKADNYRAYVAGQADLLQPSDFTAAHSAYQVIGTGGAGMFKEGAKNPVTEWMKDWIPGTSMVMDMLESAAAKLHTYSPYSSMEGEAKSSSLPGGRKDEQQRRAHNQAVKEHNSTYNNPYNDIAGLGEMPRRMSYDDADRPGQSEAQSSVNAHNRRVGDIYGESAARISLPVPLDQKATRDEIEQKSLYEQKYGDRSKGANYYNRQLKIPDFEAFEIPGMGMVGGPGSGKGTEKADPAIEFMTALGAAMAGPIVTGLVGALSGVQIAPVINVNGETKTAAVKEESPTNAPLEKPK